MTMKSNDNSPSIDGATEARGVARRAQVTAMDLVGRGRPDALRAAITDAITTERVAARLEVLRGLAVAQGTPPATSQAPAPELRLAADGARLAAVRAIMTPAPIPETCDALGAALRTEHLAARAEARAETAPPAPCPYKHLAGCREDARAPEKGHVIGKLGPVYASSIQKRVNAFDGTRALFDLVDKHCSNAALRDQIRATIREACFAALNGEDNAHELCATAMRLIRDVTRRGSVRERITNEIHRVFDECVNISAPALPRMGEPGCSNCASGSCKVCGRAFTAQEPLPESIADAISDELARARLVINDLVQKAIADERAKTVAHVVASMAPAIQKVVAETIVTPDIDARRDERAKVLRRLQDLRADEEKGAIALGRVAGIQMAIDAMISLWNPGVSVSSGQPQRSDARHDQESDE